MRCTQYDRLFQQHLSWASGLFSYAQFLWPENVCLAINFAFVVDSDTKNIANFWLVAAAILKSNMADTEVKFSVAQYLKIFLPYIWTSIPNLVLLSKSAQFGQILGLSSSTMASHNEVRGSYNSTTKVHLNWLMLLLYFAKWDSVLPVTKKGQNSTKNRSLLVHIFELSTAVVKVDIKVINASLTPNQCLQC